MVEMTETAYILRQATSQSLVLIDEIGRGTSTYDGMALAYASCAYLATKIKSYTLFSTHYFELTLLPQEYSNIKNKHLQATLTPQGIVFLYRVEEGPASHSYGIEVAKLAGMPETVIQLANQHLQSLQQESQPYFQLAAPQMLQCAEPASNRLHQTLAELDIDNMTAREALDFLYTLKQTI